MKLKDLAKHKRAQDAAKSALKKLPALIVPHFRECDIVSLATRLLREEGISETWYYGVHALVLLGSRSCCSLSGREYAPSTETVGEYNLITIDLSPEYDGYWGDYARSFIVEDGHVTTTPHNADFLDGLSMEIRLHEAMQQVVTPRTTAHELYQFGNAWLHEYHYENLDFLGNLGHSITRNKAERVFIEEGCLCPLGDVQMFTFEPHIRKQGSSWGFKHENIYYFDRCGRLTEL